MAQKASRLAARLRGPGIEPEAQSGCAAPQEDFEEDVPGDLVLGLRRCRTGQHMELVQVIAVPRFWRNVPAAP
jgi:hypothetical protein